MSAQSIQDFLAARPGCRVALVVHQRPDGDAVGSAMGLAGVLRAAGFRPRLVNCRPLPDHLRFIVDDALCLDSDAPEWWRDFDCLGVLDCGELGRLDEINRPGVGALPTFTIDHHVTSKGLGEAVWIEAEASSTGELVVRLRRGAGWPLPAEAATALWTAIVSDTGRFSQENVTPAALEAGRDCLLAGASPVQTARELYQSVSVPERRLQADVLDRLEFHAGGRLSLSWLHHADFLRAGIGVEGAQ